MEENKETWRATVIDITDNSGAEKVEPMNAPIKELSFGEKLVGITFNPSNDDKVAKAKQLCAELANLLKEEHQSELRSGLSAMLYEHTIGEILNAQMNVVKVLTLKY